jgi:hypothetical protein
MNRRSFVFRLSSFVLPDANRFGAGASVADRDHAVGLLGHARVVSHDHDRQPVALAQIAQQPEDQLRGRPVDLAGRLVGEQDLRLVRQRAGDRDALLLPAGELRRLLAGVLGHIDRFQQLVGPGAAGAPALAGQRHQQLDVLARGQVWQQVAGGLLPHESDLLAPVGRQLVLAEREQVLPRDLQPPGRRPVQPAERAQQGGLARAGRPDQRQHLAARHLQVKPLQRHNLQPGDLEDLDQTGGGYEMFVSFCHLVEGVRG